MENIVEVNKGDIVRIKDNYDREFTGFVVENYTQVPGNLFLVKLLEGLSDNQFKATIEPYGLNDDGWLVSSSKIKEATVLAQPEVIPFSKTLQESIGNSSPALEECTWYRTKSPITNSYITMCSSNKQAAYGWSFSDSLTESVKMSAQSIRR